MQITTIWFTKSRRAQTNDDYETWVEGGVTPTLNIFDNGGDTRATVLILMRWREDKPGGGKGALMSENKSLTLATANDQVLFAYSIREDTNANTFSATELQVVNALQAHQPSVQSHHAQTFIAQAIGADIQLFEPDRRDGIRLHGEVVPTLQSFMGTGGNNIPCVAHDDVHAYDEYMDSIAETHHTLRAGTKQSTGAIQQSVVRRLTPIECERLQGFPDNWTANRIDVKNGGVIEQKDSARYKQMGNAVAVPCVQWLLKQIISAYQPDETPAQSQDHPTHHH